MAGIALIIVSVAYGIKYIFQTGRIIFPFGSYYFLLIFSVGFVIFSVYFEKEKKSFNQGELIGGAIASACLTFLILACSAGIKYIWENGLEGIGIETLVYAFSISLILSLILYFVTGTLSINFDPGDFAGILSIVLGIAVVMMITVVYGINYIININPYPIPPYVIFLFFSVLFVIASINYEKRGAVYPWFFLGGAIASASIVFIVTAIIGGLKSIFEKKSAYLSIDTVIYSLSICIILSMILYKQYNIIKEKI